MVQARTTRTSFLFIVVLCLLAGGLGSGLAQDVRFFRIGTGGTGGTYFPIGSLIASVISRPPGSRDCDVGGSCGVPGLIAAAVSTQGSVDNVRAVADGTLDMALSQADVAYYAYFGKKTFADKPPMKELRAVANLYPELVHLVARPDANIHSVADLRGKRVSLGEEASGTLVVARTVLDAYGLSEKDVDADYNTLGKASDRLLAGDLDAFFMVGGYPLSAIADAAQAGSIALVPISGPGAKRILKEHLFFTEAVVPAGVYSGVQETQTVSVGAQLIVSAAMNDDLVYQITQALWHPTNRALLDSGHPNGARIRLASAVEGIAVPLHPGAARYYEEVGLVTDDAF
ncbi:MAG: TAXI family TRAP transporter solute-binding subunit [Hyphomicrobium sp.]